ncbi:MAG: transcriptional repressor [Polyangiaceae bacterium]|nr:transcriptional repressor [Polyangiaceae bacterium]
MRRGKVRRPDEWASALHDAGLRRTAPRIAVLQRLEQAPAPLSHGEIVDELGASGFDRATVYRNLVDLVEAGMVTRTDVGDHVWRFELVRDNRSAHTADHPHFLCVDCGDVSCLPGDAVRIAPSRGVPRAVGRDEVEVQIKGRCDTCAR